MNNNLIQKLQTILLETKNEKTYFDDYISRMREIYKGENVKKRKYGSNFISKEAFRIVQKTKAKFKRPFIKNKSFLNIKPEKINNNILAIQTKMLTDYFLKKMNSIKLLDDILSVLLIEGTVVIRTGWKYRGKKTKIKYPIMIEDIQKLTLQQIQQNPKLLKEFNKLNDEQKQAFLQKIEQNIVMNLKQENGIFYEEREVEVPVVNEPTAFVVKNEDIFIDPDAESVDDIKFVIHRRIVTLKELEEDGRFKNLDKLKQKINYEQFVFDNTIVTKYKNQRTQMSVLNSELSDYEKRFYIYEFWGEIDLNDDGNIKNVCITFVDDLVLLIEDNPYPDKKIPFVINQYIKEPFSLYGISLVDIISEYQTIKTGIMRSMFDNLSAVNTKQVGILKGMLDPINLKRYLNGEVYEFNIPNQAGFKETNYKRIPPEVFSLLKEVDIEQHQISGLSPDGSPMPSTRLNGGLASTNASLQNILAVEVDQIYNISENILKPLLRKIIAYVYAFMDKKEIEKITGIKYVEPTTDLETLFEDFELAIETDDINKEQVNELSFLLQTLGNNIPFDITKIILAEIANKLGMDNLRYLIATYEPPKNPVAEKMQQIQIERAMLENEDLKADIQRKLADSQYKGSKAKETSAKAEKITNESAKIKDELMNNLTNGLNQNNLMNEQNIQNTENQNTNNTQTLKNTNISNLF